MPLDNGCHFGQPTSMPSAQEIAAFAVSVATDALDQVAAFIGTEAPDPLDNESDDPVNLLVATDLHPFDRRHWERSAAGVLIGGARFVLNPPGVEDYQDDRSVSEEGSPKSLWSIQLIVETDDGAAVERLADQVSQLACPTLPADMSDDHKCEVPWFVVTSDLDDEGDTWRNTLNR
jgi:hypothetical protein